MRRLILVGPSLGGTVDKETFVSSGVKGAPPLALPPPLGERGGHTHIDHRGFATIYDPGFLQSNFFSVFSHHAKIVLRCLIRKKGVLMKEIMGG